jgi:hypothetical protein
LAVTRILVFFVIALATPYRAGGETIYAVAGGWTIFWFDSETPGVVQGSLPLFGALDGYLGMRIEFDPLTSELYGFAYPDCNITCPPSPVDAARIDLVTGETSLLDWPGFPSFQISLHDIRIDPSTREVRMVGHSYRNFRYSLNSFQLQQDGFLDLPGRYAAIAHTPPSGGEDAKTLAMFYPYPLEYVPWLGQIGDSGHVTVIGQIDIPHYVYSFDISASGNAYLLATPSGFVDQRLYRVNLETLTTEDLGAVETPSGTGYIYGIAAAPPAVPGTPEIPTLSPIGLATLLLLLGGAACYRSRLNRA